MIYFPTVCCIQDWWVDRHHQVEILEDVGLFAAVLDLLLIGIVSRTLDASTKFWRVGSQFSEKNLTVLVRKFLAGGAGNENTTYGQFLHPD
jgi:hypothetical protein